ncbi:universal stress protein [Amycolatopsis acidicola]|uniref:Universal stress protein n=1 Tax=Amycolatopsis acidicola TaxID=2596893 RepID=A0A5N0V1F4_9PSEU|nr:universal stress protein [Amycolatopsis acidicola]KAA9160216.1 universal stress protein [Amycolatopsis acidicola]
MSAKRKIVVGVDGSPQSEAALRWALGEAVPERDEVRAVLVRARDDLLPGTSYAIQPHGRRPVGPAPEYADLLHSTVRGALRTMENPPEASETLTDGDPATELVKEAKDADLLVVGSHGSRPIAEILVGSVATRCVRHAHCPVVVIPAAATSREH